MLIDSLTRLSKALRSTGVLNRCRQGPVPREWRTATRAAGRRDRGFQCLTAANESESMRGNSARLSSSLNCCGHNPTTMVRLAIKGRYIVLAAIHIALPSDVHITGHRLIFDLVACCQDCVHELLGGIEVGPDHFHHKVSMFPKDAAGHGKAYELHRFFQRPRK